MPFDYQMVTYEEIIKNDFLSGFSNNHVLMEEVKNIGKVAGCLIVFLKEKSQSIIINLKIFVIH